MERVGVISDIHADEAALEAALSILEDAKVDAVFVCGDIVGYGDLPNECCDRIRSSGFRVVAGNHDCGVAGRTDMRDFSRVAQTAIRFTRRIIRAENLAWLRNLPLVDREAEMVFVHASLPAPERWRYLTLGTGDDFFQDARESFEALTESVCFVGHSHVPVVFSRKIDSAEIEIIDPIEGTCDLVERQAIIDVGSISRPRRTGQKGSLVIYDRLRRKVEFRFFSPEETDPPRS